MDRGVFFQHVRRTLFDGRLTSGQVAGIRAILDRAAGRPGGCDARWLAYMLATAHHETGRRMQAIRETAAATDAQAIARLDKAFARGLLPSVRRPYWRRDDEGKTWLGRGLVQLTHRRNYEALSKLTGIDLVSDPGRALDGDVAVSILFVGMEAGAFSGRALSGFFNETVTDWAGARQIINGRDRAVEIAALGRAYHAALTAANSAGRILRS